MIGFFYLPEDLGLSKNHGVEPGGDAGKMAAGILAVALVEGVRRSGVVEIEALIEESAHGFECCGFCVSRVLSRGFWSCGVDFDTIACREDDGFGDSVLTKIGEGIWQLRLTKRDPFAECDGSGLVIEAETDERH